MKPVAVFTTSKCPWCSEVKNYLKSKKVRFNIIDITTNKQAKKDCIAHGCKGVPVVLIGNTWICGFNKNKINKTLGIK